MSYYNHFAKQKYKQILFADIPIGDKFRIDLFKNKRRRLDIICIKTGEMEYQEQKNKHIHTLKFLHENYHVSSFNVLS